MRRRVETALQVLVLVCFIPPAMIPYVESLGTLSMGIALVRNLLAVAAVGCALACRDWRSELKDPMLGLLSLTSVLIVLSMIMNGTVYLTIAVATLSVIGFLVVNNHYMRKDPAQWMLLYTILLGAYLVLHVATRLFLPEGFVPEYTTDGKIYFLGTKNSAGVFLLAFLFTFTETVLLKAWSKWWLVGGYCAALLIALYNRSMTTLILVCLIAAFVFLRWLMDKCGWWEGKGRTVYFVLLGVVFILVALFFYFIIFRSKHLPFQSQLTELTGLTFTYSGRNKIWWRAKRLIMNNYVWGAGSHITIRPWITNNLLVHSAHNTILDFWAKYGVVALVPYVASIFVMLYHTFFKSRRVWVSAFVFALALMILFLFEAYEDYNLTWGFLMMLYLCGRLDARLGKEDT